MPGWIVMVKRATAIIQNGDKYDNGSRESTKGNEISDKNDDKDGDKK